MCVSVDVVYLVSLILHNISVPCVVFSCAQRNCRLFPLFHSLGSFICSFFSISLCHLHHLLAPRWQNWFAQSLSVLPLLRFFHIFFSFLFFCESAFCSLIRFQKHNNHRHTCTLAYIHTPLYKVKREAANFIHSTPPKNAKRVE